MKLKWLFVFAFLFSFALASKSDVTDFDDDDDYSQTESQPEQLPKASTPFLPRIDWSRVHLSDFYREFAAAGFILLYYVYWKKGNTKNAELAQKWMDATSEKWSSYFEYVGYNGRKLLLRDSPAEYIFYASGRPNINSVYGFLKLSQRQDLLVGAFESRKDQMVLEFDLTESAGQVFLFGEKDIATKLFLNRWDMSHLAKTRENSIPNFPSHLYSVYSDNSEVTALFSKQFVNLISELHVGSKALVESVLFSDQTDTKPESLDQVTIKSKLTIVVAAADISDELHAKLVDFAVQVADFFSQCKISAEASAKMQKSRQDAVAQLRKRAEKERQEQQSLQKIKELKAKKEEMTPEQLAKFEEKEKKKEKKKNLSKRTRVLR